MPYTTTKSDFYNALYNESKTAQGGKYWSDVFKQNQQLYDQAQTAAKEGIEQVKQNLYNTENAYIAQQQALYRQGEQAKYDYSQDYNEALAKAYQSSLNQRAGLLGSNVISGYKEQNLSAMDIALDEAYKSYTKQFNQNIGNVEQTVGKGVTDTLTNINKARQGAQKDIEDITTNLETVRNYINKQNEALSGELMSEAENMEKTFNAIGDYYTYLYNQYFDKGVSKVDERDNPFLNNPEMRMMYLDEGVDEAGQPYYRLKSVDEMSSTFYDKDNEGKLTLNERGRKFYDQFLNYNPTDLFMRDDQGNLTTQKRTDFNVNDFSTWLKGKNEDLYNWLTSYDEYNSNVTGQKAGTFREMLGLKADDYTYSYLEHAGAMSEAEVTNMFSDVDKLINTFDPNTYTNWEDYKGIAESIYKEIKNIADKLGITVDELNLSGPKQMSQAEYSKLTQDEIYNNLKVYVPDDYKAFSGNFENDIALGWNSLMHTITRPWGSAEALVDQGNKKKYNKEQSIAWSNKVKGQLSSIVKSLINKAMAGNSDKTAE